MELVPIYMRNAKLRKLAETYLPFTSCLAQAFVKPQNNKDSVNVSFYPKSRNPDFSISPTLSWFHFVWKVPEAAHNSGNVLCLRALRPPQPLLFSYSFHFGSFPLSAASQVHSTFHKWLPSLQTLAHLWNSPVETTPPGLCSPKFSVMRSTARLLHPLMCRSYSHVGFRSSFAVTGRATTLPFALLNVLLFWSHKLSSNVVAPGWIHYHELVAGRGGIRLKVGTVVVCFSCSRVSNNKFIPSGLQ